jgi:hypothetical protein
MPFSSVNQRDKLTLKSQLRSIEAYRGMGMCRMHTQSPKDQMSVAVFHGTPIRTSGLRQSGAPMLWHSLANFEST